MRGEKRSYWLARVGEGLARNVEMFEGWAFGSG